MMITKSQIELKKKVGRAFSNIKTQKVSSKTVVQIAKNLNPRPPPINFNLAIMDSVMIEIKCVNIVKVYKLIQNNVKHSRMII